MWGYFDSTILHYFFFRGGRVQPVARSSARVAWWVQKWVSCVAWALGLATRYANPTIDGLDPEATLRCIYLVITSSTADYGPSCIFGTLRGICPSQLATPTFCVRLILRLTNHDNGNPFDQVLLSIVTKVLAQCFAHERPRHNG